MGKVVTHKSFVSEVCKLTNDEYTVLRVYKKAKDKTRMKHNKCGYEYEVTPDNFKRGKRCKKCSINIVKSKTSFNINIFKDKVYSLVGNEYEVVDTNYTNARTPVKMMHNICGNKFDVRPYHFTKENGTRCPKCSYARVGFNKRKSTEDFALEVECVTNDEYEVVGDYINAITEIDILHKSCNNIYSVKPNAFLSGNRCNKCKVSVSNGEKLIINFLESNGVKFIYQYSFDDCRNKNSLPFDFAILNDTDKVEFLVEYDGRQHFEPIEFWGGEKEFKRIQMHDNIKNSYCEDNNIKLIRIPYWKYENIESILSEIL